MPIRRLLFLAALLLPFAATPPASAQAAEFQPRFGGGFDGVLTLGGGDVVQNGIGLGVRGRTSFPVNADFSLAVDAGFAGFILGGRTDASYLFNPQVSGILTFPGIAQAQYLIGGMGWYAPIGSPGATGGPALHGGLGWVRPLNETSLYFELNPALIIGENRSALVIPARVGVIF